MKHNLLIQAAAKYAAGFITIALLLFLPAGTYRYWNAWLYLAVQFIPMLLIGILLFIKAPELLAKRMQAQEKETEQKKVVLFSAILYAAGFILMGFDFRYGWSRLPAWLSVAAAVIFLLGYGLYAEVIRENQYLSRTVEIQQGQKVIDTGVYGVVRHPMYTATLLLFLAIPLICGSAYAFLLFCCYPFLLVKRIRNEETVLSAELEGYRAYTEKVRFRLIPFIW